MKIFQKSSVIRNATIINNAIVSVSKPPKKQISATTAINSKSTSIETDINVSLNNTIASTKVYQNIPKYDITQRPRRQIKHKYIKIRQLIPDNQVFSLPQEHKQSLSKFKPVAATTVQDSELICNKTTASVNENNFNASELNINILKTKTKKRNAKEKSFIKKSETCNTSSIECLADVKFKNCIDQSNSNDDNILQLIEIVNDQNVDVESEEIIETCSIGAEQFKSLFVENGSQETNSTHVEKITSSINRCTFNSDYCSTSEKSKVRKQTDDMYLLAIANENESSNPENSTAFEKKIYVEVSESLDSQEIIEMKEVIYDSGSQTSEQTVSESEIVYGFEGGNPVGKELQPSLKVKEDQTSFTGAFSGIRKSRRLTIHKQLLEAEQSSFDSKRSDETKQTSVHDLNKSEINFQSMHTSEHVQDTCNNFMKLTDSNSISDSESITADKTKSFQPDLEDKLVIKRKYKKKVNIAVSPLVTGRRITRQNSVALTIDASISSFNDNLIIEGGEATLDEMTIIKYNDRTNKNTNHLLNDRDKGIEYFEKFSCPIPSKFSEEKEKYIKFINHSNTHDSVIKAMLVSEELTDCELTDKCNSAPILNETELFLTNEKSACIPDVSVETTNISDNIQESYRKQSEEPNIKIPVESTLKIKSFTLKSKTLTLKSQISNNFNELFNKEKLEPADLFSNIQSSNKSQPLNYLSGAAHSDVSSNASNIPLNVSRSEQSDSSVLDDTNTNISAVENLNISASEETHFNLNANIRSNEAFNFQLNNVDLENVSLDQKDDIKQDSLDSHIKLKTYFKSELLSTSKTDSISEVKDKEIYKCNGSTTFGNTDFPNVTQSPKIKWTKKLSDQNDFDPTNKVLIAEVDKKKSIDLLDENEMKSKCKTGVDKMIPVIVKEYNLVQSNIKDINPKHFLGENQVITEFHNKDSIKDSIEETIEISNLNKQKKKNEQQKLPNNYKNENYNILVTTNKSTSNENLTNETRVKRSRWESISNKPVKDISSGLKSSEKKIDTYAILSDCYLPKIVKYDETLYSIEALKAAEAAAALVAVTELEEKKSKY